MRTFIIKPGDLIPIGRAGENQATQIRFDVTGWADTFGAGTYTLVVKRPHEDTAYPVEVTTDGDYVVWTVSNVDTGIAGNASVQLRDVVDGALAKSVIYTGIVGESLDNIVDPPDPFEDLIQRMVDLAERTEAAAESAAGSAASASESAETATAAKTAAQTAAQAAQTAQGTATQAAQTATQAKDAAQAAKQAAEAAQSAAAQSATAASGSATAAAGSATQAAASATAADESADAAAASATAADASADAAAASAATFETDPTLSIDGKAADAKTTGEAIKYQFAETTDSRYYFQVGTNRTIVNGKVSKVGQANRSSCLPVSPPTRFVKIVPKAGTTIGLGGYLNGAWSAGGNWGFPAFSVPTIVDTAAVDAIFIQVVKSSTQTSADLPEVYSQLAAEVDQEVLANEILLTKADLVSGTYSARTVTAEAKTIATRKFYTVQKGDEVVFTSPTFNVAVIIYAYNQEALANQGYNSGWIEASTEQRRIICPVDGEMAVQFRKTVDVTPDDYDATTIIRNSLRSHVYSAKLDVDKLINPTVKTIAFLGDSITAGVGTTTIFHMYLASRYGWKCKNYGYGGSGYARTYTGTGGKMATGQEGMGVTITSSNKITPNDFLTRIATVDTTVDALVIFGGLNDWNHGDEVSFSQFTTAVNNVLSYAQTHFGRIPIVVMLPIHRTDDSTPNTTTGKTLADYCEALKEICQVYGVPCVDTFGASGLNPENANNDTLFYTRDDTSVSDGTHPNHYAHKAIANLLAPVLSNALY